MSGKDYSHVSRRLSPELNLCTTTVSDAELVITPHKPRLHHVYLQQSMGVEVCEAQLCRLQRLMGIMS